MFEFSSYLQLQVTSERSGILQFGLNWNLNKFKTWDWFAVVYKIYGEQISIENYSSWLLINFAGCVMDSDEDEVSCDIPLDDGGGAAAAEEGSEGGSLDWSVSAISGGMDPDR